MFDWIRFMLWIGLLIAFLLWRKQAPWGWRVVWMLGSVTYCSMALANHLLDGNAAWSAFMAATLTGWVVLTTSMICNEIDARASRRRWDRLMYMQYVWERQQRDGEVR